jgi:hypothetical protein
MAIFSDKRLLWTGLLLFFQQGVLVATAGYVNSGLLSTYSAGILPYYYTVSALLSVITILFSQKAIQNHPQAYVYWFYLISFFVNLSFLFLLPFHIPGFIFIICTLLSLIVGIIMIANSNSIFLAFDIREFRQVSSRIIMVTCVGGILFAVICPLLINFFGNTILLLLNSVLYLGCLISSRRLKPLHMQDPSLEEVNIHPLSIPIFRLIIGCSVLFLSSCILLDYVLKLSLKENFDEKTIGMVTTSFVGIISFLLILTQLFGKQSFVQRYGVVKTLLFLPIVAMIFSLLVLIFPAFISILILFGAVSIYSEGPCYNAIQTLYNVIPRKVQFIAKAQAFIILTIVGEAIIPSIILLFLGEKYASIRMVVLIALVLQFLSILVLWRIKTSYRERLKALVEQPRFLQFENVTFSESIENQEISDVIPQIGHRYSIYDAILYLKKRGVNPIPFLMDGLINTKDIENFEARVKMLGKIPGIEVEQSLTELLNCRLAVLPNTIPMTIAFRSFIGISDSFRKIIQAKLNTEVQTIRILKQLLTTNTQEHVLFEIKSRLELAIRRFFYYFASLNNTREVLNALPNILDQIFVKSEQVKRANAIEYLETITDDAFLRKSLQDTMDSQFGLISESECNDFIKQDPWLVQIKLIENFKPGGRMNTTEKALFLRRVKLFESLPAEILELIAEPLQIEIKKASSVIFLKGEEALKVYMVIAGTVSIEGNNHLINRIPQYGIFGELGILGNSTRVASAIAQTDVTLLTIQKQEFLQFLEDIPEISKAVIQQLVGYFKDKPAEA